MKRAVLLVEQDAHVKAALSRMREIRATFEERKKFLLKQSEDLARDARKEMDFFWDSLEDYLLKEKLLPKEYNKKTCLIGFDQAGTVLSWYDKDEVEKEQQKMGFPEIIQHFLFHQE